jgi:prepilin-type N-terminal cleavage/methylation domain-containing protein
MSKKRGFTLIELLVVIAIIAVLMGILMPALRKVKEQGNMVKCLGNLKQWNLNFSMYVDANNGKFYSGEAPNGYWWVAQMEDKLQSRLTNDLWFCPKTKSSYYDVSGTQNNKPSIYSSWGIYMRGQSGVPNTVCADGIDGSYGINGFVLNPKNGTATNHSHGEPFVNFWRTPQVKGAAYVPLLGESLRFDSWPVHTAGAAPDELDGWSDQYQMGRFCINRHLGHLNMSFCDYSARKVGLKELWTLKWHKQFNISGRFTLAGGVTASDWPDWIRPYKDY